MVIGFQEQRRRVGVKEVAAPVDTHLGRAANPHEVNFAGGARLQDVELDDAEAYSTSRGLRRR